MRIALLAPMPPAQSGIADYARQWRSAMQRAGAEVLAPFETMPETDDPQAWLEAFDWRRIDLVHAELGGGRAREFLGLEMLRRQRPRLPLSATVHDPERLVWRAPETPWPLRWADRLPRPMPQVAALLGEPRTFARERRLAQSMAGLVTLTATGAACLRRRMSLEPAQVKVIPHGNRSVDFVPPPTDGPLRLLYFGFIYPGKGLEDLLDALAQCYAEAPDLRGRLRLTLAGGSEPELAFGGNDDYLLSLQARAARLDLLDALDWRLDLAETAIPGLIQAHHAMVLPYRESGRLALLGQLRGTSGALSWANACGRGAIVSDARAFPEEVARGNGAVYPQGDTAALALQLRTLAERPEICRSWAERAARIGVERRWDGIARRFNALFARLTEEIRHVA